MEADFAAKPPDGATLFYTQNATGIVENTRRRGRLTPYREAVTQNENF